MRKYALPLVLLAAASAPFVVKSVCAAPQGKKGPAAGKAAPPACGVKIFPLVVGNSWTYEPIAAPTQLPEALARLAPLQPKKIVVSVKSIEKKGTDTVATIEEKDSYDVSRDSKEQKIQERVVTDTIVCNDKGKFDIGPQLFWFAGEPGGVIGLTFDKLERKKETSLKLTKGTIGENEWIEEITSHFTRKPAKEGTKLEGGKLELERKFTPQPQEKIISKFGSWQAEKLGIITSGRITFDKVLSPEGKPCSITKMDPEKKTEVKIPSESCELPANWISTIWIADGTGVVQTLNSYAHMYQIVDATIQ